MTRTSLRDKLTSRSGFVVLAELTGGPGFSFDPIERFLKAYKDNPAAIPAEFDLAAITLPQSPGGVANIEPAGVIAHCQAKGLLDNLDVVPHVTCKDMNADAIVSSLMSLRKANVENVLALTGDKPVKAAGVFELESLGLLNAIRKINNDSILQAKPQSLKEVRRFFPGAAVSPFKYTEPSQMQQYYKMEKKIACGAEFLITQVGWDWRKSLELFTYLKEIGSSIPVIGNVYLLSTLTPAPRLMHDGKLPGCFVSDELLAKVQSERVDDHIERAAQQVAMYKAMGAAGVDVGGVPNFEMFSRILKRAAEIGTHWEPFEDNLCWPPGGAVTREASEKGRSGLYSSTKSCSSISLKNGSDEAPGARPGFEGEKSNQEIFPPQSRPDLPFSDAQRTTYDDAVFYLYDESGARAKLITPYPTFAKRFFDFAHWAMLDPKHVGFRAFKKTLSVLGADSDKGAIYKLFNTCEKSFKYLAFDCEECGDCFLPENFGLCTIGGCEKGMDNAPCGDATADGRCGNNLGRVCIGERIYEAAASEDGEQTREGKGRKRLRTTINKPRNPALQHTSSIINYLFGKDHTMKNALISIGESIHASIPKTGQIMKELHALGAGAYTTPSPQLDYIRALIESQAGDGADYIAINLDAFGEQDPQQAVNMMVEYVRLVKKWGRGVPVCVDSSSDDVLTAGLKEWYGGLEKGKSGDLIDRVDPIVNEVSPVNKVTQSQRETLPPRRGPDLPFSKPPLLNSIKVYTMDKMMPLKKDYDFSFVGLLVSEEKATGPGGSHSVDELYALAKQLFDTAMRHGFRPEQIFFDSTVFPLAIDMPMEPGVPGYTYRTFETIKKIRSDSRMKGVHCSLGISNCVRDLPARRIGVCRAYVAKAMEYGLDAGIVNTAHQYGLVEAPPELLELVDAYAKLDGSMDRTSKAMELMAQFCRENRKAN